MENASKALIMAGAILISILLITVSIYIFSSNSGTKKTIEETGEVMALKTEDITENLKSALNELDAENLVKIPNHTVSYTNDYYIDYFPQNPKVLLEANTQYILYFDYKVNNTDKELYCSVGYGENQYDKGMVYQKYPNLDKGFVQVIFKTPSKFEKEENKPYLHIRFARITDSAGGSASVEISNVKFKKVK